MKRKLLVILLTLVMILGFLPQAVLAASPPTTVSAPENYGASNYGGSAIYTTMSAPDDLRALIVQNDEQRGFSMTIWAQVDFKTDNGNWHYASDWDSPDTYRDYALAIYNALYGGTYQQFLGHDRLTFKTTFPNATDVPVPAAFNSWNWYKSHSVTSRARFAVDFGNKNIVFSAWSTEYVLSDSSKMDYLKILSTYAPTLISSELVETSGKPYVLVQMTQHPDAMQLLNAACGDSMDTEVWLRKEGETEFKLVGDVPFSYEALKLDVSSYYKDNVPNYTAAAYEVKVRYKVDERAYQQSGATTYKLLYSPFSNLLSYGMPAWSNASDWAKPWLEKAEDYNLIPDCLKGTDMTQLITRAEFAALSVKLYESLSGKTATPALSNPFTDTADPEVLKAFNIGITAGTSPTEFSPNGPIPREQAATMLTRAYKAVFWEGWTLAGDLSYTAHTLDYSGVATFADDAKIAAYAKPSVYFMAKNGIIAGVGDNMFAPNAANIPANAALHYGQATREVATKIAVATLENLGK